MGNWGTTGFKVYGNTPNLRSLRDTVAEFPSGLKQAMFAAASTRTIRRGIWNGCALNAAGIEVGKQGSVTSFAAASDTFGITPALAKLFVGIWDKLEGTDTEVTAQLREAIENVGLFTEPGQVPSRFVKRSKVFEQQQTILQEQFNALMENDLIPDTEAAFGILVGCDA